MRPDDHTRLRHMRDAALDAMGFAKGRSRTDLAEDRQLAYALVRCIEIIGEAASTTTAELKERHTVVPWRVAAAMRNRLIHAYFEVDLDQVWAVVEVDLPTLVSQLDAVIESEFGTD